MSENAAKIAEKAYYAEVEKKLGEFNTNGKITVGIFTDAFFPSVDGVVSVVDNIASRIQSYCNVVVFAPKSRGVTYKRNYVVVGIKAVYLKSLNYSAALFPDCDSNYKRLLKKVRLDVVHAHSPFAVGRAALKYHKKFGTPFVMTFHSQYKKDVKKAVKSELITKWVMKYVMASFNGADEVWTMHRMSAETVIGYGYNGPIRFVPNATDYVYPADADQKVTYIKEHYGIKDEKIFLFVGRLVLQKNILFIAEILSKLKERGVKFKMLFIGDGPDRALLEKRLSELKVYKDCMLLGKIDDKFLLEDYYLSADMLLFPSRYDVSSIIQIEAAAMKTPCAFIENSVTSCTVTHGVNGLILPDDADKFADGVKEFVLDKDKLSALGENAYRDLYVTWDDIVVKSYDRYIELAKKK
ncbi:MAG: glycosyltransferase [Clostridia bacterium]|nr:glycosyltransferase [Clostridia bacterium]